MKRVIVYDHEGIIVGRVNYNENLVSWKNPNPDSVGLTRLRSGDFVAITKYPDRRWNAPSPYKSIGELISEEEAVKLIKSSGNLQLLKKYGLDEYNKQEV